MIFKQYKRTGEIVRIPDDRSPELTALQHAAKTLLSQRRPHESVKGMSEKGVEAALLAGEVLETEHARWARWQSALEA